MTALENIVTKKLKIKIACKRIEANSGIESCGLGQPVFMNKECGHSIPVNGSKNSEMNKSQNLVVLSPDDRKLYAADNQNVTSSAMGFRKRGVSGVAIGQKEKRRKMDRSATQQCDGILKQLMTHTAGWAFNRPVDPVELNIPDYFSIISEPMDLGTIKSKLANNAYSSVEEFAADVRLTFSNAMLYNPPGNSFHEMARKLNTIFSTRWSCLEAKWHCWSMNVEQGHISSGSAKNTRNPGQNVHKTSTLQVSLLPKKLMSAEEKKKLRNQLLELSRGKMPPHLQGFLEEIGFDCRKEERIELDIDAFPEETLSELKRIITSSFGVKPLKTKPTGQIANGRQQSKRKIIQKGIDSGNRIASASASANVNPPLNLVSSKCGSCGSIRCQCGLQSDFARASSSDLSSERSLGKDYRDTSRREWENNGLSEFRMSKSESDGAVSALDEENICSSPQLSALATTAASGEGWTQLISIQLSPKKALRAAMLKSRFVDTILKAKQKTLLDNGGKADPVKMQREKERLERQQLEEKARIEAQIRAAEEASRMRAEAELKKQREQQREAARLALQQIEKTVDINDSPEILRDLEMLSQCSLSDHFRGSEEGQIDWGLLGSPLERLGLFMKDEFMGDEDDEVILNGGGGEEGERVS